MNAARTRKARPAMPSTDERVVHLEERIAWLMDTVEQLSAQVARQDRQLMDLQRQSERTTAVLRVMALERGGPVVGAQEEDDPVPRSG